MHRNRQFSGRQAGFTLVEALVAMMVLTFGLIAVTNLFIVASSSNTVANHSTAVAAQAAEVMERLKAVRFNDLDALVPLGGSMGDLDNDFPAPCYADTDPDQCFPDPPNTFNMQRVVDGVGIVRVRWRIDSPNVAGNGTLFITVRAESLAPLAGARSRAEFTTFRTCTLANTCPAP